MTKTKCQREFEWLKCQKAFEKFSKIALVFDTPRCCKAFHAGYKAALASQRKGVKSEAK